MTDRDELSDVLGADVALPVTGLTVYQLRQQMVRWKALALLALHDLRVMGVPIEKVEGVTPEVVAEVDRYSREMETFS